MPRDYTPPEEFAHLRASSSDIEAWNDDTVTSFRTCWYCGTTYRSSDTATWCELHHEHEDKERRRNAGP